MDYPWIDNSLAIFYALYCNFAKESNSIILLLWTVWLHFKFDNIYIYFFIANFGFLTCGKLTTLNILEDKCGIFNGKKGEGIKETYVWKGKEKADSIETLGGKKE